MLSAKGNNLDKHAIHFFRIMRIFDSVKRN